VSEGRRGASPAFETGSLLMRSRVHARHGPSPRLPPPPAESRLSQARRVTRMHSPPHTLPARLRRHGYTASHSAGLARTPSSHSDSSMPYQTSSRFSRNASRLNEPKDRRQAQAGPTATSARRYSSTAPRLDSRVRVMSESRLEHRLGGEATHGRPACPSA
jgi:hypothetical protein